MDIGYTCCPEEPINCLYCGKSISYQFVICDTTKEETYSDLPYCIDCLKTICYIGIIPTIEEFENV